MIMDLLCLKRIKDRERERKRERGGERLFEI